MSSRTGMTAAMSQGNASSGTVMWMPLAGRIERGSCRSSNVRISSDQTPAAFTTTDARTSKGLAVDRSHRGAPDASGGIRHQTGRPACG